MRPRLPNYSLQLSRPRGIVLQNGVVGATLGSGRLRAPRPAGLRCGGGGLAAEAESVGQTGDAYYL